MEATKGAEPRLFAWSMKQKCKGAFVPNDLPVECDEELSDEAKAFLTSVRQFIAGYWGDRCLDRAHGCKTCQMWAIYDLLQITIET